ncbi:MAG: SirB2 family protein [Burkholderiales bacterium]|nr:MAG: SirB2 family protein [Burkholderiales bacterium]
MDYAILKLVHQGAVTVSIAGFVLRAVAGIGGAGWVRGRAARTLPHLVDTVLLGSALAMVWMARLPLDSPWLIAKFTALLVYIGLGMIALRPRFTGLVRTGAATAALLCFGYIVSVAITKSPAGFV